MGDNQVYGLTSVEAIKMLIKEQFYVIKESVADFTNQLEQQSNKDIIELLQKQNKLLTEENNQNLPLLKCLL